MIGRAEYAAAAIAIVAVCVAMMAGCGAGGDDAGAGADEVTAGSVTVRRAWLQTSASGESPVSAEIENTGPDTETLLEVTSTACSETVMHEVVDDNGTPKDQQTSSHVFIPSGAVSVLSPDSVHFSCLDPTVDLADGMTVEMTFVFEIAGEVGVVADVFD